MTHSAVLIVFVKGSSRSQYRETSFEDFTGELALMYENGRLVNCQ